MDVFANQMNPCGMVDQLLKDIATFDDILKIHAVFDVIGMRFDVADPAWGAPCPLCFLPTVVQRTPNARQSTRSSSPVPLLRCASSKTR